MTDIKDDSGKSAPKVRGKINAVSTVDRGALDPHLATGAANAEQSRRALVHCIICRPVNPAGFIGK